MGNLPGNIPPGPSQTPVRTGNLVVNEQQNNATVTITQGSTLTVKLEENPTTGYRWNMSASSGLRVVNDTYIPSDTSGKLVGSGGTRIWDISADVPGTQQIRALYHRSWEPVTGDETTFSMTVTVV
jgi:inhibitor of cysteine peptidase